MDDTDENTLAIEYALLQARYEELHVLIAKERQHYLESMDRFRRRFNVIFVLALLLGAMNLARWALQ